uniref:Uncharacterized protein n=1 Tax=Parastrongyloides trichosuri TaxID=131310 RepID=A0A0N4ZT75_PARTI
MIFLIICLYQIIFISTLYLIIFQCGGKKTASSESPPPQLSTNLHEEPKEEGEEGKKFEVTPTMVHYQLVKTKEESTNKELTDNNKAPPIENPIMNKNSGFNVNDGSPQIEVKRENNKPKEDKEQSHMYEALDMMNNDAPPPPPKQREVVLVPPPEKPNSPLEIVYPKNEDIPPPPPNYSQKNRNGEKNEDVLLPPPIVLPKKNQSNKKNGVVAHSNSKANQKDNGKAKKKTSTKGKPIKRNTDKDVRKGSKTKGSHKNKKRR